jgi:glycosyltransferase involved in cell wall biosynthesis
MLEHVRTLHCHGFAWWPVPRLLGPSLPVDHHRCDHHHEHHMSTRIIKPCCLEYVGIIFLSRDISWHVGCISSFNHVWIEMNMAYLKGFYMVSWFHHVLTHFHRAHLLPPHISCHPCNTGPCNLGSVPSSRSEIHWHSNHEDKAESQESKFKHHLNRSLQPFFDDQILNWSFFKSLDLRVDFNAGHAPPVSHKKPPSACRNFPGPLMNHRRDQD